MPSLPSGSLRIFVGQKNNRAAFSLVEVVLAIGVVAFAFVAILGLLPAGMTQFRSAIDTTICAQIAQAVIADARQADFDVLIDGTHLPAQASLPGYTFRAPAVNGPEFRYFDERASEVIPSNASARANPGSLTAAEKALAVYYVNVRIMPQSPVPRVVGETNGGQELATVTVQVISNPGNLPLTVSSAAANSQTDPKRQLILSSPGTNMLTYFAQIARNK